MCFDLWNLSPGWCLISRSVFGWMRARPSKENLQTLGLTRGVRELRFFPGHLYRSIISTC